MLKLKESGTVRGIPYLRLISTSRSNLNTRCISVFTIKKRFYFPDCPIGGGDIVKLIIHEDYLLIKVKRKCLKEKLKFKIETV